MISTFSCGTLHVSFRQALTAIELATSRIGLASGLKSAQAVARANRIGSAPDPLPEDDLGSTPQQARHHTQHLGAQKHVP
jgi:hypothetical protein